MVIKISIKRHWNADITPVKGNQSCPAAIGHFSGVFITFLLMPIQSSGKYLSHNKSSS
jgi:hypothetical protein